MIPKLFRSPYYKIQNKRKKIIFTKEEKRFIVKSFGRNPSPTKVRQDFLRHYNVQKGRKRDEYKPYHFARVNKEFEKNSSVTEKSKKTVLL